MIKTICDYVLILVMLSYVGNCISIVIVMITMQLRDYLTTWLHMCFNYGVAFLVGFKLHFINPITLNFSPIS
jgi:hypothetical protein